MARGTAIYNMAYSNVTVYKAWAQPMSDMINQAIPRTTDTGQVNWATVATEPTAARDYEIFALGGPLQATAPIFFRIDYIGGANGGPNITVGTTTNGAGALAGLTVPYLDLQQHTIASYTNQYMWAASDRESYFTFLFALDPAVTGVDGVGMVVIERTRNLAGNPTADGFHVWRWYASSATATVGLGGWLRQYGAAIQTANPDWTYGVYVPDLYNVTTGVSGSTAYAYPSFTYTQMTPGGASKALLWGFATDFPRGKAITVRHFGENQTYIPLADAFVTGHPVTYGNGSIGVKNLSPLLRWD